jgi:hypothetical protein
VKGLVFWGRGRPPEAPAAEGTRYVLWNEVRLTPEETDAVDEAAMAWTKAWGARPVRDGRSVRDLLAW